MWKSLFVTTLLGLFVAVPAQLEDSCVNPIGQDGVCMNIRRCRPLLDLLQTHKNTVGNFLRASVCGFENMDPKVCCPLIQGKVDNGDSENIDTSSTTSAPIPEPPPIVQTRYGPLYGPDCGTTNSSYPRVVGGEPAKLGAWPWAVALGYRSKKNSNEPQWLCGGSLISARHVLTAGHCVHGRKDLYLVRVGDLDLDETVQDGATPMNVFVEGVSLHPQYSPIHYTNDVAVLRLDRDLVFTDLIKPICLPVTENVFRANYVRSMPFIAGWGSIYFRGPSASRLQNLQIPVRETDQCKEAFARFKTAIIDERVICAGYATGGKDACQGDSGGSLMTNRGGVFYAIGVVSYGYKCAEPGIPGVYTRTTAFLSWIASQLN